MTSILDGQPLNKKAFSKQKKGHLGSRYIYLSHELHRIIRICFMSVDSPVWRLQHCKDYHRAGISMSIYTSIFQKVLIGQP